MLPYKETKKDNYTIREFSHNSSPLEFVWHRDKEDRLVEAVGKTDWQVQLDNELPMYITKVFIPKETWHRVIKGTGNLKVKIWQKD